VQFYQHNRERLRRSSIKTPCPVCGKLGCGQSSGVVLCWRVESDKPVKSGAWLHVRADVTGGAVASLPRRIETPLASIERCHAVYSAFLDALFLNRKHGEHLANERRLSEATIIKAGFKSVPDWSRADAIAAGLASRWELKGVPGCWRKDGRWVMRFAGVDGFYIPIRNAVGQIEALQIRAFSGQSKYLLVSSSDMPDGVSSGAPHHFTGHPGATVIVTEGALKAEVISEAKRRRNENDFVIGLVAVATFEDSFGANLKQICPFIRTVQLAFDSDWRTNEKVQKQMTRLANSVKGAGLKLQVLCWESEEKGYDDELLRGER
jgi:hypothetical protein